MTVSLIRRKLFDYIRDADEEKVRAIYTLIEDEMETDTKRKKTIQLEREKYLRNEGDSYTPAEVREMALNKSKRHAL